MNHAIADLRKEYASQQLLEADVIPDPIIQFGKWWEQAISSQIQEPNAMTLATASRDGLPAARIVLLKGFDENGFVFYTNYQSYKALQIEENPKACLVFFWKELERQVRIVGLVKKIAAKDSDAYYHSRPQSSRIGAWASPQSQVIENREWLDKRYLQFTKDFNEKQVERPPHWGGYVVQPVIIEFWQGRPGRMHDRIQYSLQDNGTWKIERLAP
ncbi:MAG TPA: pyridoxamine 5'-phosphate oxidase [Flavisolibacter sp.]|jgi:pyridoxamine 5'-phosphate oxidase|nr:pyridoxamine 5'-phosphate oxidase [Flavisolibacter sp.]